MSVRCLLIAKGESRGKKSDCCWCARQGWDIICKEGKNEKDESEEGESEEGESEEGESEEGEIFISARCA
jgi:hypothetical protein